MVSASARSVVQAATTAPSGPAVPVTSSTPTPASERRAGAPKVPPVVVADHAWFATPLPSPSVSQKAANSPGAAADTASSSSLIPGPVTWSADVRSASPPKAPPVSDTDAPTL